MSFGDWQDEEKQKVQDGMLLIGWRADSRLTDQDAFQLKDVADQAVKLKRAKKLTSDEIDRLAVDAFKIMSFQIMNVGERVFMASGPYSMSKYLSDFVTLIDEATICHYRGYHTAALAIMFIVLEGYLLKLGGWRPGLKKPKFAALQAKIKNHPESDSREEAGEILAKVYANYDAASPPQFLFNRHGLLHGLRGADEVDLMNCVRMFLLFDLLCQAEGLPRSCVYDGRFNARHTAYANCKVLAGERALLKIATS